MPRVRERVLRPVRPNLGLEVAYRRKLQDLIRRMNDSVVYWISAKYKANTPEIAQDELPATVLKRAMRKLARQWQDEFNELAPKLAEYFATAAANRSDVALRRILRDAGFTVKFQITRAQQDVLKAAINENVSLIRSIPSQYFTQIEGSVMRAVTAGHDLGTLTKELQEHYGVSYRRASFIARDQSNKATAALTRTRRVELQLFDAVWLHSHGGRRPRPKHVAASGQPFDIRKGMKIGDKGQWVQPGEEPNCRCVSRPVIKGLT